ncbi:hypothetical protein [Rhodothermus marinus]|uniref:hypothetical protein n=1 Tax=Rhodothermus marinus TaxID=29549 RepID=UPI001FB55BF6|nr:hypothetical protein [Rhodothermus marinus]
MRGQIKNIELARPSYRYLAFVEVETDDGNRWRLPMTGTVAQWLRVGQRVQLAAEKPQPGFDDYSLRTARVAVWPLFERIYTLERRSLFFPTGCFTATGYVPARPATSATTRPSSNWNSTTTPRASACWPSGIVSGAAPIGPPTPGRTARPDTAPCVSTT